MVNVKYSNAYTEVYEILKYLNKEDYNKIPKDFLEVIEKNRNFNYEYRINNEIDLEKQPMLIETKAILLNIYRDFLANQNQKEIIKKLQYEDIKYIENQKREKYDIDIFKKEDKLKNNINDKDFIEKSTQLVKYKKGIFQRIIDKILNLYRR